MSRSTKNISLKNFGARQLQLLKRFIYNLSMLKLVTFDDEHFTNLNFEKTTPTCGNNYWIVHITLTIGGSISVLLTSCLTGLDSTKQVNLLLIQHKQSSWIQTKLRVGQLYIDTSSLVNVLWIVAQMAQRRDGWKYERGALGSYMIGYGSQQEDTERETGPFVTVAGAC